MTHNTPIQLNIVAGKVCCSNWARNPEEGYYRIDRGASKTLVWFCSDANCGAGHTCKNTWVCRLCRKRPWLAKRWGS